MFFSLIHYSVGYWSVQTIFVRGEGLWRLTPLSTICHDGHFIGGGNRSTWRKSQTCYKSATHFITQCRQFDVLLIPNQTHFLE
jgi:hypothetical protein